MDFNKQRFVLSTSEQTCFKKKMLPWESVTGRDSRISTARERLISESPGNNKNIKIASQCKRRVGHSAGGRGHAPVYEKGKPQCRVYVAVQEGYAAA